MAEPIDYRAFLQGAGEVLILPYFEGGTVCDDVRTYRVRESSNLAAGWYRFSKAGRYVSPLGPAEPEWDRWKLKPRGGYQTGGRFVSNDFQGRLFGLPTDVDLQKFVPISVVEWFDCHLLFRGEEFESEVEEQVRRAFEEERSIESVRHVTPALAHTFLLECAERELGRERERRARELAVLEKQAAALARSQETFEGRIAVALSHTGAELISWRRTARHEATIRYRLGGQRFECVINSESLQIIDAGICLSGADQELSLGSLPSAVREAVESGRLHIMRRL